MLIVTGIVTIISLPFTDDDDDGDDDDGGDGDDDTGMVGRLADADRIGVADMLLDEGR